jgi:hypothetical protein
LALENYDASGAWRVREGFGYNGRIQSNDPLIDASAQMPNGRQISGVTGLQDALLEQQDAFLLALTKKLFTYALGRSLGYSDEQTAKRIVAELDHEQPTLRSLIHAIVMSREFQSR